MLVVKIEVLCGSIMKLAPLSTVAFNLLLKKGLCGIGTNPHARRLRQPTSFG